MVALVQTMKTSVKGAMTRPEGMVLESTEVGIKPSYALFGR
jgi:hypothetical protein